MLLRIDDVIAASKPKMPAGPPGGGAGGMGGMGGPYGGGVMAVIWTWKNNWRIKGYST